MTSENNSSVKKPPLWRRILKWTAITAAIILGLILVAVTVTVWVLTPQRLTPLIERTASENLEADVTLGRAELTFWSTFPHLEIDINELTVKSRALAVVPDRVAALMPQWADSLLSVSRLHGSINVMKLLGGSIAIGDVTIVRPEINLLQATRDICNFDIIPPSDSESGSSPLPDFSIGTFEITGQMPVRYVSIPDSIDVALTLKRMSLGGKDSPEYALDVDAESHATLSSFSIDRLRLGMVGKIRWDHHRPSSVALDGFLAGAGPIEIVTDADVDLDSNLTFHALSISLRPVALDSLISLIPEQIIPSADLPHGDVKISAEVTLTSPYTVSAMTAIPSAELSIAVSEGAVNYDRFSLKKFALDASAEINGKRPDESVITVSNLYAVGNAMGFRADATVTHPLTDPLIRGSFKGGIVAQLLPQRLLKSLPFEIRGEMHADCTFDLRKSYLTRENFHRIKFTGHATLNDLIMTMRDASAHAAVTKAAMKLGTNSSVSLGSVRADSLLTVSVEIDSLSFITPDITLAGKHLNLGLGSLNKASSADTTIINPIGGKVSAGMLSLKNAADSTSLRLREATVSGALTRFKSDTRKPDLRMKVAAKRAVYADNAIRAFISDADAALELHPSTPRVSRRMQSRMDSIRHAHPDLPVDSVYSRARRNRSSSAVDTDAENSFGLDNSTQALIKEWNVTGNLKARRIGLFTPYFPLRNTVRNLDMAFSSDSVKIHPTQVRLGKSSLTVNGTMANISRSLTSRRGSPLKIDFEVSGDTVDVNAIASAVFAGAAYGESAASRTLYAADTESEDAMQSIIDATAADSVAALVIPSNIDAELRLKVNNVIYSDLMFHNLRGKLMVYGGAINLQGLSAATDIGSVNLNALYSAPDRTDLKFAFAMMLNDFKVGRFIRMMPAIDSIMPLLNDISGIINAQVAATSSLTPQMDIDIPSLSAVVKIEGDSLVLLDNDTFKSISKWLMFKNKQRNMIDHMAVEMTVKNSNLELYPFVFDIDRYRLGVMGHNDLALNYNYHIAVIKSPIPFKFGINVSGNPDKMKIRLGRAKLNERTAGQSIAIADTTRINLVKQIEQAFRRGISAGGVNLNQHSPQPIAEPDPDDHISAADSAVFINEGLLPAPPAPADTVPTKKRKKK